jgi:hypothetical protein
MNECPAGGLHEWLRLEAPTDFQGAYMFPRRCCVKCNTTERWRVTALPTPENAPGLGRWEEDWRVP